MTKCSRRRGERKLAPPPKRRRASAAAAGSPVVEEEPAMSYLRLRSRSVVFVDRRPRLALPPAPAPAPAVSIPTSVEPEEGFSRSSSNAQGSEVICEVSTRSFCESGRTRRETTPMSVLRSEDGDLESTEEIRSRRRRRMDETTAAVRLTPTDTEIDDFFLTAERDEMRRFTEKYNFDIINDVPLNGRYEWIRI